MEAKKLKVELLMNGLSGKELARILKVSPTTLYRKIKNPRFIIIREDIKNAVKEKLKVFL